MGILIYVVYRHRMRANNNDIVAWVETLEVGGITFNGGRFISIPLCVALLPPWMWIQLIQSLCLPTMWCFVNVNVIGYLSCRLNIRLDLYVSAFGFWHKWQILEMLITTQVFVPRITVLHIHTNIAKYTAYLKAPLLKHLPFEITSPVSYSHYLARVAVFMLQNADSSYIYICSFFAQYIVLVFIYVSIYNTQLHVCIWYLQIRLRGQHGIHLGTTKAGAFCRWKHVWWGDISLWVPNSLCFCWT